MIAGELVERYLRPRGIVLYTGRAGIAQNVAESTVGLLIANLPALVRALRTLPPAGRVAIGDLFLPDQ